VTELGGFGGDEAFVPRADVLSAGGGPEVESTNVCRAAALAMMLRFNSAEVVQPLTQPLGELGFALDAIGGLGNDDLLANRLTGDWFAELGADLAAEELRRRTWESLNQDVDPNAAVQFLIGVLGSSLERETAAAAAALWQIFAGVLAPETWLAADDLVGVSARQLLGDGRDWDPDAWQSLFTLVVPGGRTDSLIERLNAVRFLVLVRLRVARESADPVTRSLALAVRMSSLDALGWAPSGSSIPTPPGALVVSTMVHGTWGWKGDWWRPKGGFHQFIASDHRPNLYGRGARFSWSGAYSQKHRIIAAEDLVEWAQEVAPNGLQTVFAHSYGGEVAAMAAMAGATTQELVLLSVPGTGYVNAAASSVNRVIDVRMPFDIVLAIANTPQRLAPASNLTEVLLPWYLMHTASHNENVWLSEDVAGQASL
jgi:pimeloyl-ACP methyl ester carboxylesterase